MIQVIGRSFFWCFVILFIHLEVFPNILSFVDCAGDILDDEAKMEKEKLKAKLVEREPTGRVVGIIRRKWRQYCGILQPSQDKNVCSDDILV